MGLAERTQARIAARVQHLIDAPITTAANFHWPVSWQTRSSATSHPELAGGLPEVVIVALTADRVHLCAPAVNRVTHEATRGGDVVLLGSWPRWMLQVQRLDKPTTLFGKELTTLPSLHLSLPGYEDATLAGAQGATPSFLRVLLDVPASPPLTFGDLVTVTMDDGRLRPGRYLAGPFTDHRGDVIWVCHDEAGYWNAVEREGRDPDGEPHPADRVRRAPL